VRNQAWPGLGGIGLGDAATGHIDTVRGGVGIPIGFSLGARA